MNERELQTRVREDFGLRLRPAMSRYVLGKMQAGAGGGVVPVIGGDARTGRAVHAELPLAKLAAEAGGPDKKSELS